ncbi:hypothetical protein NPIL_469341, partial [Nephila pilipes]
HSTQLEEWREDLEERLHGNDVDCELEKLD